MSDSSTQRTPADASPASHAQRAARRLEPADESALLVVLPHPDDESFGSGGTMAKFSAAGLRVHYLCATYGDMGRRMGKPAFANRESLRDVREVELADACRELGATLSYLGLRDRCVEFEDLNEVGARIRAVIEEFRPSSVVGFYPGYGVHPDHDAIGQALVLALRQMPRHSRPRLLATAVGDHDQVRREIGEPNVTSDIRAFASKKIDALRAHRSQTEVMFANWFKELGVEFGELPADVSKLDEQSRRWHERITETELYYDLDPDVPTVFDRA